MKTETISIKVDSEVARVYQKASGDQKKKMEILVNLWLKEFASDKKTLKQVMDDISEKAKAKGLTLEILDSALNRQ
jgi:ABC-type uncharacterized transport system ATPase component